MAEQIRVLSGWERAYIAAEKVKERLRQVVDLLKAAQLPYAVIGGNAVAEWVKLFDDGADRNTRDVDILIRRADETRVKEILSGVGLAGQVRTREDAFLRGDARLPRNTVFLHFEGEKFLPDDVSALPCIAKAVEINGMAVVDLFALVQMKLTAFRTIDRVHIRDLIDVGQIDNTWPAKLTPPLGERLQEVLDDPNG